MGGHTRFGNGHHLHLYVEIRSLVDDHTGLAFFGDIEVRCPITGAVARHDVILFLRNSESMNCCNEEKRRSWSTPERSPILQDSINLWRGSTPTNAAILLIELRACTNLTLEESPWEHYPSACGTLDRSPHLGYY